MHELSGVEIICTLWLNKLSNWGAKKHSSNGEGTDEDGKKWLPKSEERNGNGAMMRTRTNVRRGWKRENRTMRGRIREGEGRKDTKRRKDRYRAVWLGQLWFWLFHHLHGSAWEIGRNGWVARQYVRSQNILNHSQLNPPVRRDAPPCRRKDVKSIDKITAVSPAPSSFQFYLRMAVTHRTTIQ